MNYRNPKVEALEAEVKKLKHKIEALERFGSGITSTVENPIGSSDIDFFRVASMSVSDGDLDGTYHFITSVRTPPNELRLSYFLSKKTIDDSKSAYDVITYLTEEFMYRFYKELMNENKLT